MGGLFLLLFAVLVIQPLPPADFWWHLQVGETVLEEGRIPQTDLFSYTAAGQPFHYQSWLAGVILALCYRLGGAAAVVVLNAILLTLAYGLLWAACREASGHHHPAALATLIAVAVSAGNWAPRPQTFSILLYALFLWLLLRLRQGKPTPLWLLPSLIALWANLHGAFVLGLALLGSVLVVEWAKPFLPGRPLPLLPQRTRLALLGTTLAATAAPLFNPAGWRILDYVRAIQGNPIIRQYIAEWQPPSLDNSVGVLFYLSLLGLFFLLLYRGPRPDPAEALWLAGTAWLALGGVRSIIWYSFILGLLAARGLQDLPWRQTQPPSPAQARLNLALLALLAGLVTLTLPWCKGLLPLPPDLQGTIARETPLHAADWIEGEGPGGHIFHRMEYGGYLLWRFYPERRVFIDSRIELYPPALWQDYARISGGQPEAVALLDHYGVAVLLLDRRLQAGLLEQVRQSGLWQVRYENPDEESVVLTRR